MTRDWRARAVYVGVGLGALLAVAVVLRALEPPQRMCQRALSALAGSRQSAARFLDWEHLTALEVDVGAQYLALPNAQERSRYRLFFIRGFGAGFKEAGATPATFINWRVEGDADGRAVVAADHATQQKTLLLHVRPVFLGKKIDRIEWKP